MDLRQLRYFCAVAHERNFTRAAETLHIAQPPLSRQIQLLEEELGVQLILRSSRPLRLTDAGRLFHEQALQILGRVEQMQAATRRVGLNERSVLAIGFVASTLYGGLPLLVRKLRQHSPELDIRLMDMTSMQQIEALKAGRIDISIGRLRHNDPAVAGDVLREERLALAVPLGSPLATTDAPVPVSALAGQLLIVYPKDARPGFADQVLTLLRENSAEPSEVHEAKDLQTALGLVAAETGVCVVPSASRQLRADLHYRLIEGERATSPVVLNYRRADDSRYIGIVKKLIQEMYAENPPWLDLEHNLPTRPQFGSD
ncbi:LysR family transcriptional regulator [Stenotrophomonas tumulicola]|uniref:LysR family transcriptional regulator n=1 Tax=Stenotrophomonas tumulicola TaxID=1685415 RepID=A0A7W3FKR1_9GAMM|nr:LysR family transcriptional regulator [Stenotrophomonas tumulicola]MBA8681340.1 LysR family transcriptional regulator [Stenotrophomonas tumulicola]